MAISNDYNEFKEEIELAYVQNAGVEIELYSIIACIIRDGKQGSSISLRDVSSRRRSTSVNNSNRFSGAGGFPDFVILERDLKKTAKILGCIEAKMLAENLNKYKDRLQKHIKSFHKVLYTNGLEWRFYNEKEIPEWTFILGELKDNRINWKNVEIWKKLLDELDNINWIRKR